MKEIYQIKARKAKDENIILFKNVRVTLITDRLVRIEWSKKNSFCDDASQKVWVRDLGEISHSKNADEDSLTVETERLSIILKNRETFRESVEIRLKNPMDFLLKSWRFGDEIKTLKGTARTLDNADGEIPLEEGILSKTGFSVLDDSKSCLIQPDGSLKVREDEESKDIYFFAYGLDYKKCLKDFLAITGLPPLLPRWALGNWWSRYHRYTEREYLELMKEFKKRGIPLSVAMIDMDWHWTEIDRDIGSGWTGYSWNKNLFPEPKKFLEKLHAQNLKVSLNVHPAEGVGRHEDAYKNMKKALGQADDGKTVPFDITNPDFVEAYFDFLHHPLEKEGVDFWWIDWQQGKTTALPGLDPLWALNHYHYLDNKKSTGRALILSRYSGPGSHRYPIGFSGDTVISWDSLKFQPYFTATASNIGYGWWSHDIGGHMLGTYDEELQVRWVQYGVFSPIMRLHSSSSEFNHKEPWKFGETESSIITSYLRLRHRLIPYLYGLNIKFTKEGLPPVEPLYYEYPKNSSAYSFQNEYFFGQELLVAPITSPVNQKIQMAGVKVWIPEGSFTDIFTGITYTGEKETTMYRNLSNIPVLLKSGGILALSSESEIINPATKLPECLDLYVSCGADGNFTLTEDSDEITSEKNAGFAETCFEFSKNGSFTVCAAKGFTQVLPKERTYSIHFLNCDEVQNVSIEDAGLIPKSAYFYDSLKRELVLSVTVSTSETKTVLIDTRENEENDRQMVLDRCFVFLDKTRLPFLKKEKIFAIIKEEKNPINVIERLLSQKEDIDLTGALLERLANK